jgi:hypothetical protein
VHLVAGAVQEAGVDEGHAAGGSGDAGLEVDAGAAFFVHDAQLHGAVGQAQHLLDAAEQFAGKGHLGRAVHLGLDDVDAASSRELTDATLAVVLQVVQRDGGGDHRVHDAFGDLLAATPQHGRVRHQVPHVAQEHEAAAVQAHLGSGPARGTGGRGSGRA